MDTSEKISIIVPVYNVEPYIEKCVESLINQTYKNLEIILVDDGSKDNSWKKLTDLEKKDSRIKILHKENGGVTSARFEGLKIATGNWIGFIDGDDYIEENMYETLLDLAYKNEADIAHCGYRTVFSNCTEYHNGTEKTIVQDNFQGLKDLIEGKFIEPCICNKLYKKSLFENMLKNNLVDYSIKIYEDLLMNFYLFKESKKSVFYDICLYTYMMRSNSATTKKRNINKLLDPLKVLKVLVKETGDIPELNIIVKTRYLHWLSLVASQPISEKNDKIKSDIKDARKELRKMLPDVLKENYSLKTKTESLWTAVWPTSNKFVHKLHKQWKRRDKKYEV